MLVESTVAKRAVHLDYRLDTTSVTPYHSEVNLVESTVTLGGCLPADRLDTTIAEIQRFCCNSLNSHPGELRLGR